MRDEAISKIDWRRSAAEHLREHSFQTELANGKRLKQKNRNINKLLRKSNQLAM